MWSMIFIKFKLSPNSLVLGLLLCHSLKEMIMIVLLSHLALSCSLITFMFSFLLQLSSMLPLVLFYFTFVYLLLSMLYARITSFHLNAFLFYFDKGGEFEFKLNVYVNLNVYSVYVNLNYLLSYHLVYYLSYSYYAHIKGEFLFTPLFTLHTH